MSSIRRPIDFFDFNSRGQTITNPFTTPRTQSININGFFLFVEKECSCVHTQTQRALCILLMIHFLNCISLFHGAEYISDVNLLDQKAHMFTT